MSTPPVAGFVRFTKTLYDAILAGRFTAAQLKVVLAVVRYTLGHNDQADGAHLSRRLIADATHLHERTVRRVLADLKHEGVVCVVAPARGRRAAKILVEPDCRKWGRHSPSAPPLRRAGGNPENLRAHQFDVDPLSARVRPHNAESLCGRTDPPLAGVQAPTNCGRTSASSEELEEHLLKSEDDAASAEAAASSSPEYFDWPGWGRIYREDTWAYEADDTRAAYLKAFGTPPRRRSHV